MIDFGRSYFTWKSKPMQRDPYYKYAGGFVGREGAVHRVRIQLEAACTLTNEKTGHKEELFLLCPCRTEFTIVKDNLFQIPNGEFRPVFGREFSVPISSRPSTEREDLKRGRLADQFADHSIEVRVIKASKELNTSDQVIQATAADDLMNGSTTYSDPQRGVTVTLEYPIKLINLQQKEKLFQVCMGPVPLPDLATWDGVCVDRVFLAELAFSDFDYIEFALRRDVEASEKEKGWLTAVRGRDRRELHDPAKQPPTAMPPRSSLKQYHEIISQKVSTVVLSASVR
jgi:hypothetical protein